MSEATDRAYAVVAEAMQRPSGLETLIALQYLGMLVPDALAPLRGMLPAQPTLVDRILSVPPAPDPVGHLVGGQRESLFARWMEGEVAWSPAVMGWADDDERADGYRD